MSQEAGLHSSHRAESLGSPAHMWTELPAQASRMTIPASWAHPPPCLLLTLLLGLTGVAGEKELQVIQPERSVSVEAGETATLNCTATSVSPLGPFRWFRGKGSGRELIYSFPRSEAINFPRVTNAADSRKRNNTDYSIHISNISPADTGTYYCVKFRDQDPVYKEFKSGAGTRLTVSGSKVLLAAGVSAIYVHRKLRA
ncbi:PREDICTED: signal-regulatory protein beta-1-like isoform X2 [Hipposideros armiger]|uniref:Signal-regulatory protein beta-1-like isoform X2 n=1 Tax=Hipposideros armiger TaxID=186990 RepID=A0A8B7RK76_HIPAR|nr:PREDICTED: signal-regulatory protein beta-1-like isoform X2 [Hipposideros armiger]